MCLCSCSGLYICVDCALDDKKRYCFDHLLGQFFFFTFCANSCPFLGFSVLCLLHELAYDILYKFFGMVCWVLGFVLFCIGDGQHKCVGSIHKGWIHINVGFRFVLNFVPRVLNNFSCWRLYGWSLSWVPFA